MAPELSAALGPVRRAAADRVLTLLIGERPPSARRAPGPGLFGTGSAAARVHADPAMLVGGLAALILQSLHPLAMAAVAGHSAFRQDPWGRLRRTARFLGEITFAEPAEAERAVERVNRVHQRIRGVAADGRPYRAGDPHLLAWVHAAEVHCFLRAHERYGRSPLASAEADRYVREMAEAAARLGAEPAPRSRAELAAALEAFRPELWPTPEARSAVRFLLTAPMPLAARGPYAVVAAAAVGVLPGFARRLLLLPQPPLGEPLVVRPAATALLRTLGWLLSAPPAAA
ncbi:MAG: oxygenase MpaB family protein [Acidimicrobiales bacterium]